ncbi:MULTISPECIES: hypothetical protein [unclassified Streptomyces]|uniref:hypothetical protein n=1 Tax=unclassified Streptomyces TaxID=2593676 RepID=UPI00081E3963|nr:MULTISPECIES: hypothetical protein [unclassified Streptomyces]MYZ39844.1 hypothetical protein [Streptomyces sp. SID4917]SCG05480.1 phosphoribosylaminoimidazolecarboxamide formyltransferase / IMP cyclohydrolase [Streptomyces sp. MnatMP-M17]
MYAVLSVTDKTGIVELGAGLRDLGATVVATRGTADLLGRAGTDAVVIGDLTGVPELMGGRVRAFHPSVFGGLLYRRGHAADEADAKEYGIPRIDVLVCNFRDLEADGEPGASMGSVDVGGPAMVRAAAKNFADVLPVVDPADYGAVLDALAAAQGRVDATDLTWRQALAAKAFARTAAYDRSIERLLGQRADPA